MKYWPLSLQLYEKNFTSICCEECLKQTIKRRLRNKTKYNTGKCTKY
jgi:mannose-1-phosphate guanylyltransferase